MPDLEDSKPSFSRGRRWMTALNSLLTVGAFLALVVMVNYLAAGHFKRFQWARNSAFLLSPRTLRVVDSLTNDVSITIFFEVHGENEDIYSLTSGLLAEYQNANPHHVHVKTLDYTRFDGEAKELLASHRLTALKRKDFVLIESGGHSRIFYAKDLADYDYSGVLSGQSKIVRRTAYRGEMYFTEAIFAVSNPRPLKAYFVEGHGEHNPGNPSGEEMKLGDTGYSKLAAVLKDEINSEWDLLSLQGTNPVPADCSLLIIAGPRQGKFTTNEVEKIGGYLRQGGRLLALLNEEAGLGPALATWGVGLGDLPVEEHDKNYAIGPQDFLAARMTPHPIMQPIINEKLGVLLVMPHPVNKLENASKAPGAPDVTALALSSEQAVCGLERGVFPLIAAVEQGVIKDANAARGGTRLVVAGDSYFLDDQMIDAAANHYFAGLALNWLLERPDILLGDLGPRPIKEYKLVMTQSQTEAVRWLFLGAMPGVVLLVGGLVWLRRRN